MIRSTARLATALLVVASAQARAADRGCDLFVWNVTAERALFSAAGEPLAAGRDAGAAPTLVPGRLAVLNLPAQAEVSFAQPPVRPGAADAARGGLLRLTVPVDGEYRIALSSAHAVDVVDGERLLRSTGFNAASDCRAPRKLLRYQLPGGRLLLIQLSGAADAEVRLGVTREPQARR